MVNSVMRVSERKGGDEGWVKRRKPTGSSIQSIVAEDGLEREDRGHLGKNGRRDGCPTQKRKQWRKKKT